MRGVEQHAVRRTARRKEDHTAWRSTECESGGYPSSNRRRLCFCLAGSSLSWPRGEPGRPGTESDAHHTAGGAASSAPAQGRCCLSAGGGAVPEEEERHQKRRGARRRSASDEERRGIGGGPLRRGHSLRRRPALPLRASARPHRIASIGGAVPPAWRRRRLVPAGRPARRRRRVGRAAGIRLRPRRGGGPPSQRVPHRHWGGESADWAGI
jgi:hypothetical protein